MSRLRSLWSLAVLTKQTNLDIHTTCSDNPMRYMEPLRTVIRDTNYSPVPAPWNKGIPVHQIKPQHHETSRGWRSDATARRRLTSEGRRITAKYIRITDGVGPAQTQTIPLRVDRRESIQPTRRGWIGARSYNCKVGSRGVVLVQSTCGWAILLAGAVARQSQSLSPPVAVGLEAHNLSANRHGGELTRPSIIVHRPCMGRLQSMQVHDLAHTTPQRLAGLPLTSLDYYDI